MRARSDQAKDERRMAFLNAAMDEFFERGFAAARVDDIAQRAGLSKGTLYLYFKSKEALFLGLVKSVAVPKIEQMEMLVANAPTASAAISGILRFVPQLIRGSMIPRIVKVLIGDGGRFPEVAQAYRQNVIDRALGLIAAILKRGQDNGEFTIEDPDLTARLVVAPLVFSTVWHILFERDPKSRVDLEALFALHERMLLQALSPKGETA